jgi:hypothetical protein
MSVLIATRLASSTSNAWPRISSFASVLSAVRHQGRPIHVPPTSSVRWRASMSR